MATKSKKAAVDPKAEEKAAKRKARMEALKNRPAEQRPNSKQIDVLDAGDTGCVKNFGYPIKVKGAHIGILVTSVAYDGNGNVLSSNVAFVPGDLTVKAKKGHGTITAPKVKKAKGKAVEEEAEED